MSGRGSQGRRSGDPKDQKLYFAQGPEATGKSTFINAIRAVFGTYGGSVDPETLLKKKWDGVRHDLADLAGLRLVTSIEPQDGRGWDAQRIQQLTGGDPVKSRRLYENDFTYTPMFTLIIGANNKPEVPATNGAFWRRIRLVKFDQQIPEAERDRDLPRKLREPEVQRAILAWLVRGCLAWQAEPVMIEPEPVRQATTEYREENDPVRKWADECLIFGPGESASANELRGSYVTWCRENGETPMPQSKPWGKALEGLRFIRDADARRIWRGGSVRQP